jgi:hypothetical protein
MTEHQAQYDAVYQAVQEVIKNGYGEVRIVIYKGKIQMIEKKETVKVENG